ncbi:peptidase U32 family [Candidatus Termititenax persephonae]|uniref:Peptidase U32 family n=1 Tax=Candidatus Termititenax persephonae TaxID=2218525 RepID=A0A388TH24_9BACT|nr:peptidase U32 family [Candidatus Termititenax persephonae]
MPRRPELLSPAGDLEKLQTAVRFGADAVYAGAENFSLRADSNSFTLQELGAGIRFAHEHGCKFYLALNIYAFDHDLAKLLAYFQEAVNLGIDAVIVSDPGVLRTLQELGTGVKFHISTQANTTNSAAVKFWLNNGATRIVAARELTLEQLREIKQKVPAAELEVFIHGALCIAYSGRCLLSRYLTGRSANRGECAQPCRWAYTLRETNRPDVYTAEEDQHGLYILNSRDLCLLEHLPELITAGIDSCKIEGRMKSAFYTAMTTKVYRQAIDTYLANPAQYSVAQEWRANLAKISHRPYTDGLFSLGEPTEYPQDSAYIKDYDFVGIAENYDVAAKRLTVSGRNQFRSGDELEILDSKISPIQKVKVGQMRKSDGEIISVAHNSYQVTLDLAGQAVAPISKHSILYRKRT